MSMNTSHDFVIDKRRRAIAAYRLRGLSIREIHMALIEVRETDPKTGKPWAIGTIHRDLKLLEQEWKEAAQRDISEHKGRLLAELDEVKRQGWSQKDSQTVLSAIQQQRQLLGADAPKQTQLGGIPGGEPIAVKQASMLEGIDLAKLNEEELDALERAVRVLDGLRAAPSGEGTPQPA